MQDLEFGPPRGRASHANHKHQQRQHHGLDQAGKRDQDGDRKRTHRPGGRARRDERARCCKRHSNQRVDVTAAHRVHDDHRIQADERCRQRCTFRTDRACGECHKNRGCRDRDPCEHLERENRSIHRTRPRAGESCACQCEQRTVVRVGMEPLHGRHGHEAIVWERRKSREVRISPVESLDASVGRVRIDVSRKEQRTYDGDEQAARRCSQHGDKADPLRPRLENDDRERRDHHDEEHPRDRRQSAASDIGQVR